jgi:hypothetical protein
MAEKPSGPPNKYPGSPKIPFVHPTNWYAIILLAFLLWLAYIILKSIFP